MNTSPELPCQILSEAMDLATDHGQRAWLKCPAFTLLEDGAQLEIGERTIRVVEDDTAIRLFVFTGGIAMLLQDEGTMTANLAAAALPALIAEMVR